MMKSTTIYRIYTEKKNRRAIVRLVGTLFDSFTLQTTVGYYRGKNEDSIVIEVVGSDEHAVKSLASAIQKMNGQKSVLVIKMRGSSEAVRNA